MNYESMKSEYSRVNAEMSVMDRALRMSEAGSPEWCTMRTKYKALAIRKNALRVVLVESGYHDWKTPADIEATTLIGTASLRGNSLTALRESGLTVEQALAI